MKFERNYLKEIIDDMDRIENQPEPKRPSTPEDKAFTENFFKGLIRMRREKIERKRAEGLCMSLAEFRELAELTDELAGRVGLDCSVDLSRGNGLIILIIYSFYLDKEETPDLIETFARLFARADRIDVNLITKYDRTLSEIAFSYDLDE